MTNNIIRHMAAQGDVLFRRVDRVPDGARVVPRTGPIVVAHSETGHHHTIDAADVVHYEHTDPLVCYLQVTGEYADVVHRRPYDTHATLRLKGAGAVWEGRRQREMPPEGWERRVRD